ncbi:hypothetical protein E2320_000163 [Naja naja]|nr:hypothetical protein E2320_000163 [Naja naja]
MTSVPFFLCFHPTSETWESYINRFDCFLDAADLSEIPSQRRKAYFLSFCGTTVFDTTTDLLAPQTVKDVSWENLQEVLSNHFSPKPSHIARHLAFRRRAQALVLTWLPCELLFYIAVSENSMICYLITRSDLTLKVAIEESIATEQSTLGCRNSKF